MSMVPGIIVPVSALGVPKAQLQTTSLLIVTLTSEASVPSANA